MNCVVMFVSFSNYFMNEVSGLSLPVELIYYHLTPVLVEALCAVVDYPIGLVCLICKTCTGKEACNFSYDIVENRDTFLLNSFQLW